MLMLHAFRRSPQDVQVVVHAAKPVGYGALDLKRHFVLLTTIHHNM
jgi:hypothetical protein